jgi:hypothetical protein
MRSIVKYFSLCLAVAAGLSLPQSAFADGLNTTSQGAKLQAERHKHTAHKSKGLGSASARNRDGGRNVQRFQRTSTQPEEYRANVLTNTARVLCSGSGLSFCRMSGGPIKTPSLVTPGEVSRLPQVDPQEAAYVAVTQLRLTPPKPVIGPSPDINEWHMAAVGYPYWLWADGDLNPAAVSTTVADLTVRLDAHLASTTFDLGDGTRLTCTDLTARWTPAVEPAAPSPACGHTYTKPSLPKGKYTITAYSTWSVDWSVNGVGGTIPLYQQASTTVPVGELQVLTH